MIPKFYAAVNEIVNPLLYRGKGKDYNGKKPEEGTL